MTPTAASSSGTNEYKVLTLHLIVSSRLSPLIRSSICVICRAAALCLSVWRRKRSKSDEESMGKQARGMKTIQEKTKKENISFVRLLRQDAFLSLCHSNKWSRSRFHWCRQKGSERE